MLLSFTRRSLDNVLHRGKTTTVRLNAPRWAGWYEHAVATGTRPMLQVWAGNPRSGGTFVAETHCISVVKRYGDDLTDADAQRDGFGSRDRLMRALARLHHMNPLRAEAHEWAVVTFEAAPVRDALLELERQQAAVGVARPSEA